MNEFRSHYTPKEQDEIFDNWANHVSATSPKLAEEIVRNIVGHELLQFRLPLPDEPEMGGAID